MGASAVKSAVDLSAVLTHLWIVSAYVSVFAGSSVFVFCLLYLCSCVLMCACICAQRAFTEGSMRAQ